MLFNVKQQEHGEKKMVSEISGDTREVIKKKLCRQSIQNN